MFIKCFQIHEMFAKRFFHKHVKGPSMDMAPLQDMAPYSGISSLNIAPQWTWPLIGHLNGHGPLTGHLNGHCPLPWHIIPQWTWPIIRASQWILPLIRHLNRHGP